jgi:hypothetical protein
MAIVHRDCCPETLGNFWKHGLGRLPDTVSGPDHTRDFDPLEPTTVRRNCRRTSDVLNRLRILDLGHSLLEHVPESLGLIDSLTDSCFFIAHSAGALIEPHDNCV